MNDLEKLFALLTKSGRTIKFGEMVAETADPLVAIKSGASAVNAAHLLDAAPVIASNAVITVYAGDYLAGYGLCEEIKQDVKAAVKDSVKISYQQDAESVYDAAKQRYVFKTYYKILKI